ncbi:MAG: SCO family protein [Pseudomonadota bacterium]
MKHLWMAVTSCLCALLIASAAASGDDGTLPDLGPAPYFNLVTAAGEEVQLAGLRGHLVVVSFFYTWCPDVCPLHTDKMALIRDELGDAFGRDVVFASITFDPARDTPDVLIDYAKAFDANVDGWHFLTGDAGHVRRVSARYGLVTLPADTGFIDHNLVTTLVDRSGRTRVQYAGYRFDPRDVHADLQKLLEEP